MSKRVDNHPLGREFPEHRQTISRLKSSDAHFKRLMDKHEAIDRSVVRAEQGVDHLSDADLEALKVQRVRLKDELYSMLNAAG